MHLMLCDGWFNWGDVPDLVTLDRSRIRQVRSESRFAMGAGRRVMRNEFIDPVGGYEVAGLAFVTGLSPARTGFAAWGSRRFGRGVGRIR